MVQDSYVIPKTKGMTKQMAQNAPQGQHLLAQGSALGMEEGDVIAPCRGSIIKRVQKVLPLQGDDGGCPSPPRAFFLRFATRSNLFAFVTAWRKKASPSSPSGPGWGATHSIVAL